MRIATWNVNNRVGTRRFRPEAANAAIALAADIIVFTEFFPQSYEAPFRATLSEAGWKHQLMSDEPKEVANRVLVASKLRLIPLPLALPTFDQQFPANLLAVEVPSYGLSLVGLRVPTYDRRSAALLSAAWDWIEVTAAQLRDRPAILLGDLNVSTNSPGATGAAFRRILNSGWRRATGLTEPTYFGPRDARTEIDHILVSPRCDMRDFATVRSIGGFALCGTPDALSDHAALVCGIHLTQMATD